MNTLEIVLDIFFYSQSILMLVVFLSYNHINNITVSLITHCFI